MPLRSGPKRTVFFPSSKRAPDVIRAVTPILGERKGSVWGRERARFTSPG